jgi:hypothetical protein
LFELVIIAASSALGALSVFILHGSKAVTNHINKMKGKAILHPFESTRSELESLKLDKDSLVDKINRAYKAKNEGKIDTYDRDKITSPNEKVKEKFTGGTPIATNIKNNNRSEGYNYTEENIQKIQHEITKAIAELEEPNVNSINNTTGNYEPSDKKTTLERAQKRDALSFLDYFYDKS